MDFCILGPWLVGVGVGAGDFVFCVRDSKGQIKEKRFIASTADKIKGEISDEVVGVLLLLAFLIAFEDYFFFIVPEVWRVVAVGGALV